MKNSAATASRRYFDLIAAACLAFAILAGSGAVAKAARAGDFHAFIESLWPDAKAQGITRKTFDAAFAGVEPDYSIPDLDLPSRPKVDNNGQAEFTKTAADYLVEALSR